MITLGLLADEVLDGALVGNSHGLLLDGSATIVEALGLVHGALKGIALPAEHVVGVCAESVLALEAPDEGVGATGPQAVELGGVPNSLVGQLGHTDGMAGWARWGVGESIVFDGVEHMRLVVGGIEVLAIPASRFLVSISRFTSSDNESH
jgi:hypothetical protein